MLASPAPNYQVLQILHKPLWRAETTLFGLLASTVNVAINVPVDNKKNAFFEGPFEVIIWDNQSLFCSQNLYKKANCNAKMRQNG